MKKQSNLSRGVRKSRLKLCEIAKKRGVTPGAVTHQITTGIKTLKIAKEYAAILGCEPIDLLD